nr:MAG TPA: hypothetical protein [Caudoviricetes sp.]
MKKKNKRSLNLGLLFCQSREKYAPFYRIKIKGDRHG